MMMLHAYCMILRTTMEKKESTMQFVTPKMAKGRLDADLIQTRNAHIYVAAEACT